MTVDMRAQRTGIVIEMDSPQILPTHGRIKLPPYLVIALGR